VDTQDLALYEWRPGTIKPEWLKLLTDFQDRFSSAATSITRRAPGPQRCRPRVAVQPASPGSAAENRNRKHDAYLSSEIAGGVGCRESCGLFLQLFGAAEPRPGPTELRSSPRFQALHKQPHFMARVVYDLPSSLMNHGRALVSVVAGHFGVSAYSGCPCRARPSIRPLTLSASAADRGHADFVGCSWGLSNKMEVRSYAENAASPLHGVSQVKRYMYAGAFACANLRSACLIASAGNAMAMKKSLLGLASGASLRYASVSFFPPRRRRRWSVALSVGFIKRVERRD